MTGAATWEQIMFVLAAIGGVMGAAWFLWSRIEGARDASRREIEAARTAFRAEVEAVRSATGKEIDALWKEYNNYRLTVAERYATSIAVSEFDKRVMQAIGSVKTDINTRFDDMQRMFEAVMDGQRRAQ